MGSKGRRFDNEPKLNMKKVIAVIVAIAIIIMFIYFLKNLFSENKPNEIIKSSSYFTSYEDGKWGVIDNNGESVINPSYEEMIVIPDSKIDIFLCTYDVDYQTGEYKTKALNAKNEEILTQYEGIEALPNKDNNHLWYEQDILKVEKDGKYGAINYDGKEILPIEYEEISSLEGVEGTLRIKKNGKYGIASIEGKILIQTNYADIQPLGEKHSTNYIVKDESGKYGIIGYSETTVLPFEYEEITNIYGNNMYVITKGGKQVLIDKDGNEILTEGFDKIKQILKTEGEGVIFEKGGKFGIMNLNGEVTQEAKYEDLSEAKTGFLIYKQNGKYGIITSKGEQKIAEQYTNIIYQETADIYIAEKENYEANILDNNFQVKLTGMLIECNTEEGYLQLLQNGENKYYTFKFEEKEENQIFPNRTLFIKKQNGKYGFVDKEGKVVVDYQYDDATPQNEYGFAGIKKDGSWGSIDKDGKVVQEPIYDLEDNLLVEFIGRWHLGEDLYMNYYNKE